MIHECMGEFEKKACAFEGSMAFCVKKVNKPLREVEKQLGDRRQHGAVRRTRGPMKSNNASAHWPQASMRGAMQPSVALLSLNESPRRPQEQKRARNSSASGTILAVTRMRILFGPRMKVDRSPPGMSPCPSGCAFAKWMCLRRGRLRSGYTQTTRRRRALRWWSALLMFLLIRHATQCS